MSANRVDHVVCDGCTQLIDWANTLYRVWFTDSEAQDRHFHNHACMRLYVDAEELKRKANLELEAAHKQLHAALDAAENIIKDEWQAAHGIVESHTLEETQNHLAQIGASQNG